MMRFIFSILIILITGLYCICAGQNKTTDSLLIVSIADKILKQSTFDFSDRNKTTVIAKLDQSTNYNDVFIRNPYNEWRYWNGVLHLAMIDLGKLTGDKRYADFVSSNYQFAFKNVELLKKNHDENKRWNYPFNTFFKTQELDDCGAEGAGLADLCFGTNNNNSAYKAYLKQTGDHILHKQSRLPDGTLMRNSPESNTIWADDLYMGVIFLAKMGRLTGEQKYFDDAVKQVYNFEKYLFSKQTNLYYHCWYNNNKTNGVAHWGRCNGWVMMAQVELLECLPKNSPHRKKLIQLLLNHIIGVSRYQHPSGLWHQLINKNDSYLETSATAMFTYSITKAVNNGWISKNYAGIAVEGWKGLKSKIDAEGNISDICMGTGIQSYLAYYYTRERPLNDIHGIGPVLMAGIEMMRLKPIEEED
jgi:unsaturated rhamnogalacturonyl hydrolase